MEIKAAVSATARWLPRPPVAQDPFCELLRVGEVVSDDADPGEVREEMHPQIESRTLHDFAIDADRTRPPQP